MSQHDRFTGASSNITEFNNCKKLVTVKVQSQGCRYHKLRKTISELYRRHVELVSKHNVCLKRKKLLQQALLEHEFYGGLVYNSGKLLAIPNFLNNSKRLLMYIKRQDIM